MGDRKLGKLQTEQMHQAVTRAAVQLRLVRPAKAFCTGSAHDWMTSCDPWENRRMRRHVDAENAHTAQYLNQCATLRQMLEGELERAVPEATNTPPEHIGAPVQYHLHSTPHCQS